MKLIKKNLIQNSLDENKLIFQLRNNFYKITERRHRLNFIRIS